MSSRTRSQFGSLSERTTHTPVAGAKPCIVDGHLAGIVWNWTKTADTWTGWVAYVDENQQLHVGPLPADRLQPAANTPPTQP